MIENYMSIGEQTEQRMINLDGVQLSEVYTWETGRPHISLIFSWIFSIFSNSARAEADPKNCSIFLCTVNTQFTQNLCYSLVPGSLLQLHRSYFRYHWKLDEVGEMFFPHITQVKLCVCSKIADSSPRKFKTAGKFEPWKFNKGEASAN